MRETGKNTPVTEQQNDRTERGGFLDIAVGILTLGRRGVETTKRRGRRDTKGNVFSHSGATEAALTHRSNIIPDTTVRDYVVSRRVVKN